MVPALPFLEWFHDGDGWTMPEGRRAEFVALVVGTPAFAWFVQRGPGLPRPGENWLAVVLGVYGGLLYTAYYREAVVERIPLDLGSWTTISLFGGGLGLSLLELLPVTTSALLALFAAAGTILAIYVLRLVSPLHEGIQPIARGAEPPPAVDGDR